MPNGVKAGYLRLFIRLQHPMSNLLIAVAQSAEQQQINYMYY